MSDTPDVAPEPEPDEIQITDNSTGETVPAPDEGADGATAPDDAGR